MSISLQNEPQLFQEAEAHYGSGRMAEARAVCERLIAAAPHHHDALNLLGIIAAQDGDNARAVDFIARAAALSDDNPDFHSNLGVVLERVQQYYGAAASYHRALTLRPDDAVTWFNRGNVLRELGQRREALECYERALTLQPDFISAEERCFWLHVSETRDIARIMQLAGKISAHRAKEDADKTRGLKTTADFRLLHDYEQAAYLLNHNQALPGLHEAHMHAKAALDRQTVAPAGNLIFMTDAEAAAVATLREQALLYPAPALAHSALNPGNDWPAVEAQYFSGNLELVVIDNLLSPEALESLRSFALTSTIWRREYANQYLGAFSEGGFVSPLHLQIADELREKMPRIFGDHRLEHLWAFKYASSQTGKGINVHADFARVNLNFWITPDDANLDPQSGGLIVYDVPSPTSWNFQEYNNDPAHIYAFLQERGARSETVPYRCNRAVLFNSNLFHETDAIRFKEGFESSRINVTYLFGRGLKA